MTDSIRSYLQEFTLPPHVHGTRIDWERGKITWKAIMNETDFLIELLVIIKLLLLSDTLADSCFCPPHPDLCRTFWQEVCGVYRSSPSFRVKVINLYLLLSWVWWLWLFHWNVKKRDHVEACVCVHACLAELASTPGLASRLCHMVAFIMNLAIH